MSHRCRGSSGLANRHRCRPEVILAFKDHPIAAMRKHRRCAFSDANCDSAACVHHPYFLFGAGEAGCFPNLTKAFTTWLPQQERVRAQGIMWMFARWGGAFTPPLVVLTFSLVSWRWAFVIYGCLGSIWAVFFFKWFPANPRDHKSVNAAELELLAGAEESASGHGDVP